MVDDVVAVRASRARLENGGIVNVAYADGAEIGRERRRFLESEPFPELQAVGGARNCHSMLHRTAHAPNKPPVSARVKKGSPRAIGNGVGARDRLASRMSDCAPAGQMTRTASGPRVSARPPCSMLARRGAT